MCFRETSFTALQQEDTHDLLRVIFPVQINRVIIKLASDLSFLAFNSWKTSELAFTRIFLRLSTCPPALEDMPSAPLSPAMPSEPNVLPVSPAPGSAASITSAVPGPLLNVAPSTPARHPQTLMGPSSTVLSFSKLLCDIGALPSDPDVEHAPSECNPPLTDRAFRYQRRDALRAARTKHAGMFDPADTLSKFDSNEPSIESSAQNSLPSRLPFPYTPSRALHTQNVAVTCPHMTHAPTATAHPPFSAGARFSLRDFPPLVPVRALCSMSSPTPLRSGTASAAEPSAPTGIQGRSITQDPAALMAASADTSPVALRTVSNSGAIRSRGLCPDAPVPSRTLTPDLSGPPTHLAHLTAV